ncbi:DUF402 domain-containing protein [Halodesulfurarchaeum sp.]|uniref:DUF402 domain-containing protein n=1 Tax=Halodesulfurarchaeum sp. TaxID=1980530 RepID=UPI002FC32777
MADGEDGPPVRIRGIYATALTEWLQSADGPRVVDPSPPISDRFEAEFPTGDPAVRIGMTADRLGLSITGEPVATATITDRVTDIDIDTFAWTDPTPQGAIFDGRVDRTDGRGMIVDIAGTEAYLPDRNADGDLSEGETIRVQVRDPVPPWIESRPHLETAIRVLGGIASLRRGVEATVADTPAGDAGHELARTTDLLSVSIPDRWGVEWNAAATEVDMATLEAALARVVEQATEIENALETDGSAAGSAEAGTADDATDALLAQPLETNWVRFGRESRFALDEQRAAVTQTIPGHHRLKAGSEDAGTAVDLVEALGSEIDSFPFGAATESFGPTVDDSVRIVHSKPTGEEFALGRGTVTDRTVSKQRITVTRELSSSGRYDAIGTRREPGDTATTRFAEGRWWYPTVYRGESGTPKGTYVNIATPVEVFPTEIRYMDLYIDVIKRPDGTVNIVDQDELGAAIDAGHVPEVVADRATGVAQKVADVLRS